MYKYGLHLRPAGIGYLPPDFIEVQEALGDRLTRHGVVVYDRCLTPVEVYRFDLVPILDEQQVEEAVYLFAKEQKSDPKRVALWKKAVNSGSSFTGLLWDIRFSRFCKEKYGSQQVVVIQSLRPERLGEIFYDFLFS